MTSPRHGGVCSARMASTVLSWRTPGLSLSSLPTPSRQRTEDGGRRELFRVRTRPLGQELWRVVIEEDGAPFLELNEEVPDVFGPVS